jgi:hypothetical protein
MTYRLYRLAETGDSAADAMYLGRFADFEAALAARDEDTVRLFAGTRAGDVLVVHHDIRGPGAEGRHTRHPVSTAIERRDPRNDQELHDIRDWLQRIHAPQT